MSLTYSEGEAPLSSSSLLLGFSLLGLNSGAHFIATISCLTYFYFFKNTFNSKEYPQLS